MPEGFGPIGGNGNDGANRLTGNSDDNAFGGGGGNDTIDGLSGADSMSGNAGRACTWSTMPATS